MLNPAEILADLPAGLTEDDLNDMVDGSVPAHREPFIIDALRARPRLGLLVKSLRADRDQLHALGAADLPAPAALFEMIEARLEQETLRALVEEADEAPAPIPIGTARPAFGTQPQRPGIIRILAESPWSRRFATAASIAVVGGLSAFGVREFVRRWPRVPGAPQVASNQKPGDPLAAPDAALAATDGAAPELASTEAPSAAPNPDPTAAAAAMASADPAETPGAPLSAAAAVKLAQEGRLVLTVRASPRQLAATLKQLEGLSRVAAADTRWRSHDLAALPVELAQLATPSPDSSFQPAPDAPPPVREPTAIAGEHPAASSPILHQPDPGPAARTSHAVVKALRTVRMNADAQRLGDLLRDLDRSKDQAASFRVLAAPLDDRPSMDAESVLWWSGSGGAGGGGGGGPEAWSRRITLPIVVESVE